MTERKYNKIIKLLNKVLIMLREEKEPRRSDEYGELKVIIKKAIRIMKVNNCYWNDK